MLEGKKVLNFGCGGSNIGPQLKKDGIDSDIVDLDLKFDPIGQDNIALPVIAGIDYARSKIDEKGKISEGLLRTRRYLGDISGRKFYCLKEKKFNVTINLSLKCWIFVECNLDSIFFF